MTAWRSTDLRETLQRIQPELRNFRAESAELQTAKEDPKNKAPGLMRLESKHDDLCAELKVLKATLTAGDVKMKALNQRFKQQADNCRKAAVALPVA
jgi:chromosome segregation ATPase